jgi:hypothetical protein
MDDYLLIMQHLDSTKRFKKFFDPLRLKTYIISPSEAVIQGNVAVVDNDFVAGCRAYLNSDFELATKRFKQVFD